MSRLSIIRVKWCNPEKGVSPSPTPRCSSNWKESFWLVLNYFRQLYLLLHCNMIIQSSMIQMTQQPSTVWSFHSQQTNTMMFQNEYVFFLLMQFLDCFYVIYQQKKGSKICWSLLEKQEWTHQRHSPMDPYISVGWTAKIYIYQLSADTGCSREDLPRWMAKKNQKNPYYQLIW